MSTLVAVTGVGAVSAFGAGYQPLVDGLRSGERAISQVDLFDTSEYRARIGAQIATLPATPNASGAAAGEPSAIPQSLIGGWSDLNRSDRVGLSAAHEALADASLMAVGDSARVAIAFGAGNGGTLRAERFLESLDGRSELRPRLADLLHLHAALTADCIAARFGLVGPRISVMTACSSSANAIGLGRDLLRLGRADVVLAGGADTLCRLVYAGFSSLRALDAEPCRPFSRDRAGLTLGEAAAFLVLEPLERALARGARVRALLLGSGNTMDAHHLTAPSPDGRGAAAAMGQALAEAARSLGVTTDEVASRVAYVNAHGTGTPHNDPAEASALHTVFGPRAAELPVSSTKAQVGHCLSAAGALEAVITVGAMEAGFLPATVGLVDPDPACQLGHIREPRELTWRDDQLALSSSFAFGGSNAALCFGPPGAAGGGA